MDALQRGGAAEDVGLMAARGLRHGHGAARMEAAAHRPLPQRRHQRQQPGMAHGRAEPPRRLAQHPAGFRVGPGRGAQPAIGGKAQIDPGRMVRMQEDLGHDQPPRQRFEGRGRKAQPAPVAGDQIAGIEGVPAVKLGMDEMGRNRAVAQLGKGLGQRGEGQPAGRLPFTTLPQAFAELRDGAVSPHLVHAQLYGWNAFYARDLIASYGRGLRLAAPAFEALARRLIVAQIFLHSDHSARIDLRLAADGRLSATPRPNPETGRVLRKAARRLGAAMRHAGLLALVAALRQGPVGSSFHAGGSMPMAKAPRGHEADILGRPAALKRIHVVDASVLPAIPATTITLSVMANAHRIGSEAP